MANVEITENTIIRSLVRKGSNSQRQQIVLEEGELGYTTDTERLFVGNGSGTGEAAGVKYLGNISDFSLVAAESPMPGDFFKFDGNLYARKAGLSGSTAAESLSASSVEGYDVLGIAAKVGTGLKVDTDSKMNVLVDDQTIQFTDDNKLQVKEIPFSKLSSISPVSLLGNSGNTESAAEGLAVNQNSVIGRKTDNTLTNVSFKDIVSIGNEELNNAGDKYNSAGVQTGAGFNVDDTGRITWAGVPKLHVDTTSGQRAFTLPNNPGCIVKIYMTGGAATGAPGGVLIFYAKISSDPSMRTISYRVGNYHRGKGGTGQSTWLKFYDSSNTLQTFSARGGVGEETSGSQTNTVPGGAALGDVINIPSGKGDNRSYDSEASFWGSEGPGSAGSYQSGSSQSGSVVIEYYEAL